MNEEEEGEGAETVDGVTGYRGGFEGSVAQEVVAYADDEIGEGADEED